jgi:hypothetical protein
LYSSTTHEETAYDLYVRGSAMLRDGNPFQAVTILTRAKLHRAGQGFDPRGARPRPVPHRRRHAARREFAKAVQLAPADDYATSRSPSRASAPGSAIGRAGT